MGSTRTGHVSIVVPDDISDCAKIPRPGIVGLCREILVIDVLYVPFGVSDSMTRFG